MGEWVTCKWTRPSEYERVFISVHGKVSSALYHDEHFYDDVYNIWSAFKITEIDAWMKSCATPDWIVCSDRLPEPEKYVYVTTQDTQTFILALTLYIDVYPDHTTPMFLDNEGCYVCHADETIIWQEIPWPEPYRRK